MRRAMTLLAVAGGAALTTIVVSPPGHNFEAMVNGQSGWPFRVTLPRSTNPQDTLRVKIVGRDASQFGLDLGPTGGIAGLGASTCDKDWRGGSCIYIVVFRPTSRGLKDATLEVSDARGNANRVPLSGIAIESCRPVQVPCNYLDLYEGVISTRTALETAGQNPTGRTGRWLTETTVTIAGGTVWCQVGRNDSEEDNHGGRRRSRSSESGTITGDGLAAIEFRKLRGGGWEYTLKFACPEPATTGTSIDYESNTSGTSNTPASPVKWTGQLAIDPTPVKAIGEPLVGKQIDPYDNAGSNDGVQGGTTTTWSLKRWR